MILTEKPKRIHLTFRDPSERRSKTVTMYGCTLEQAMEKLVGKSGKSVESDRRSRTRKAG